VSISKRKCERKAYSMVRRLRHFHSPTGDLAGIATPLRGLQLEERCCTRRCEEQGDGDPAFGRNGCRTLEYLDEFTVGLRDATGTYRPAGERCEVKVDLPVDAHVACSANYTDADIHNLNAYIQNTALGVLIQMKWLKSSLLSPCSAVVAIVVSHPLQARDVDAAMLRTRRRIVGRVPRRLLGQRHSRLTQITPQKCCRLGLAWAFQTKSARR